MTASPAPAPAPASNSGKMVAGCGGCGCALGLLLGLVGTVLFVWGNNDSKVDELIPVGGVMMGVSGLANFAGLVVLVAGIFMMKSGPPKA